MKNIVRSLVIVVAVAAVASFATYAAWNDSVTLTGITYSTGNASLKIANQAMSTGWHEGDNVTLDEFTGAGYYHEIFRFDEEPLFPGKVVTKSLYLANFSTAKIDLDPTMQVTNYNESKAGLWNQTEMKVDWGGNATGTGWQPLSYFTDNKVNVLDENLKYDENPGYPNNAKYINVSLRLKTDAGNEWQNVNANFNLLFDATQVTPAT